MTIELPPRTAAPATSGEFGYAWTATQAAAGVGGVAVDGCPTHPRARSEPLAA